MESDVITLCKYTKKEVYDRRKEECKTMLAQQLGEVSQKYV